MNRPPRTLAGIALVVAACACFSALDATTKYVSASAPLLMALTRASGKLSVSQIALASLLAY